MYALMHVLNPHACIITRFPHDLIQDTALPENPLHPPGLQLVAPARPRPHSTPPSGNWIPRAESPQYAMLASPELGIIETLGRK
jgi:hypothetical protein